MTNKKQKSRSSTHISKIEKQPSKTDNIPLILKSNVLAIALFFISLIVNVIVLADYSNSLFSQIPAWDGDAYWKWAQQIAAGNWLGTSIFHQSPLYPYFLSLFVMIFGKVLMPVYIAQALLSACSTFLIYSITRKLSGSKWAGAIAGLLFAFYGMQVFYSTKILSECLSIFLMLIATRLLIVESFSKKQLVGAGSAVGLLLIAKPHFMLVVPLICFAIVFLWPSKNILLSFKKAFLFILPIIFLVGIVALRNYVVGKDFVLVSSNGGENFYIGNNEKASGVFAPVEGISLDIEYQNEDVNAVAIQKSGHELKRSEVSSYWFHQGLNFIANHPKAYLKLLVLKFKYIFSGAERSTMYYLNFEKKNTTHSYAIPFVSFYILFPLFAAGLVVAVAQWRKYFLPTSFMFVNMLNIIVFFHDTRFMLLSIPFWIMLGAVALQKLWAAKKGLTVQKIALLPTTVIFVLATALSTYIYAQDTKVKKADWHMFIALGDINFQFNNLDAALAAYTQSSYLNQNDWLPVFCASKVYFKKGKKDLSAQLYLEALHKIGADFTKLVLRDNDLEPIRQYIRDHKIVQDSLPN